MCNALHTNGANIFGWIVDFDLMHLNNIFLSLLVPGDMRFKWLLCTASIIRLLLWVTDDQV